MSEPSTPTGRPGLRERKKQQTRARIIDVALELCDTQGFDATTVEQIADAADVSPRTVNRYFESKEAILIAPIEDFGLVIAEQLRAQPVTGNELRALLDAFLEVIDQVAERDYPMPFRWFQQMQRVTRDSPAVRAQSLETADTKTRAMTAALAERLQCGRDAMPVKLIAATWHGILRVGLEGENSPATQPPDCPLPASVRALADNVVAAYDEFIRVCAAPAVSERTAAGSEA